MWGAVLEGTTLDSVLQGAPSRGRKAACLGGIQGLGREPIGEGPTLPPPAARGEYKSSSRRCPPTPSLETSPRPPGTFQALDRLIKCQVRPREPPPVCGLPAGGASGQQGSPSPSPGGVGGEWTPSGPRPASRPACRGECSAEWGSRSAGQWTVLCADVTGLSPHLGGALDPE